MGQIWKKLEENEVIMESQIEPDTSVIDKWLSKQCLVAAAWNRLTRLAPENQPEF